MSHFRFRKWVHIPLILIGAAAATVLLADPLIEMPVSELQLQQKIDEELPATRSVGPGLAHVKAVELDIQEGFNIISKIDADIKATGSPFSMEAVINLRLSYASGKLMLKDMVLTGMDFDMPGVVPGSLQYTFVQGVFVGGVETVVQDMKSRPLMDFMEGPIHHRAAGHILQAVDTQDGQLILTLAPGRLIKAYILPFALALIALSALGALHAGHRKSNG